MAQKGKPPSFPFYTKEWLSSSSTRMMTAAERGVYAEMLVWQWEDGAVTNDPRDFARMAALDPGEVEAAWPVVREEFVERDGVLVNPRLEAARKERVAFKKARSQAGKKGNEVRWKRRPAKRQPQATKEDSSDPTAIAKVSPALALALASKNLDQNQDLRASEPSVRTAEAVVDLARASNGKVHQALMQHWLSQHRTRPDDRTVSRNAAVASRLATACSVDQLALAVRGIVRIAPYTMGEPWDLFDLERKMAKAMAAAEGVHLENRVDDTSEEVAAQVRAHLARKENA